MTLSTRTWLFVAVLCLFAPSVAHAQRQVGLRIGVSGDPSQFFFGGHIETRPLFEHVTFRPNLEIGVGSNVTVFAFNFEFVYSIPLKRHPWRVYLGGGPAAVFTRANGNGNVGGGFNVLAGIQHTRGLFFEVKAGASSSPGAKFAVGYAFR